MGIKKKDTIKQTDERKSKKRTRRLLETKLCSRNLIKGIHTRAVPLLRSSGPFLKWKSDKLRHKEIVDDAQDLIPKEWHRFYVPSRKRACQNCRSHGYNNSGTQKKSTKKNQKRLITAPSNSNINRNNFMTNMKTAIKKSRKQKLEENLLYRYFK